MKLLSIILALALLVSCSDRTNFEFVGKETLKAVFNNDSTRIKEMSIPNMDSIEQYYKDLMNEGYVYCKDKKFTFIMTDTSSVESFSGEKSRFIHTYFKIDTSYYSLNINYIKDKKDVIFIKLFTVQNLSKDYELLLKYMDYKIKFRRLNYKVNLTGRVYEFAKVEIQNEYETDIDYLKIRIILKNGFDEFVNQTIVYNGKIPAGDIILIDIPGMSNLDAGFIIKDANIEFHPEVIELSPLPESREAKIIERLKKYKR